jgi:transposase
VKYHPAHISRLLKRIACSVQKPVEQASQRNEEAIALWKTEQWPALKKSSRGGSNHRVCG